MSGWAKAHHDETGHETKEGVEDFGSCITCGERAPIYEMLDGKMYSTHDESEAMTEQPEMMSQTAPYPVILDDLVKRLHLESGWGARLVKNSLRDEDHGRGEGRGLTLIFNAVVEDTYHPGEYLPINHFVIVPAATYNEASWQRWLMDAYCNVRLHECMENFAIADPTRCRHCGATDDVDGDHSCTCPVPDEECTRHPEVYLHRPYAPNHGPGENPYVLRELTTDEARRTQFTGGLDHNRARPEGWSD